jgi:hypothetical protein
MKIRVIVITVIQRLSGSAMSLVDSCRPLPAEDHVLSEAGSGAIPSDKIGTDRGFSSSTWVSLIIILQKMLYTHLSVYGRYINFGNSQPVQHLEAFYFT